jgi:tetratricopeptide (TPR) repeat protein
LAHAGKRDFARAIDDLNQAIALNPRYARGYANLAAVDEMRRDPVHAIANADEALRLDPKDPFAFNVRGKAWLDKEQYAAAVADFDQAIRLDPTLAEVRQNLARAQAALAPSNLQQREAGAAVPAAAAWRAAGDRRVALVIGNSQYRSRLRRAMPKRWRRRCAATASRPSC